MNRLLKRIGSACCALPLIAGIAATGLSGCEDKKKTIIDIETPGTDIKLKKSKKDGSLELDIKNGR